MKTKFLYLILIVIAASSLTAGAVYGLGTITSPGSNLLHANTLYALKVTPATNSTIAHIVVNFQGGYVLNGTRVFNVQNIGPGHLSFPNSTALSYDVTPPAQPISAGTQISIILGNIINPSSAGTNTVTFATKDSNNVVLESGTITLNTPTAVTPDITDSGGNVGIGTSTPQNTLDVNGIIQTEGNRIINVGTPTATTDVQIANHLGLLGSLVKGICGNNQILQYQSSNSTWVCATPLSAAITSINGDTTAAQKILRESGNTTVTNSTGQVKIGIGQNVVITGGAAQTISKQMTFSSNVNLGGNLASTASSGTFKITTSGADICIGSGC